MLVKFYAIMWYVAYVQKGLYVYSLMLQTIKKQNIWLSEPF